MQRPTDALHHEVRLRAAAWARRLVEWHGADAEAVVRGTLRRKDLTERERLAARFTRDALADLRRQQRHVQPPRRPTALPKRRFGWLFWFRRGGAPANRLPHH